MSSEYFKGTSLYLVRLKTFEWIKCLRRHLHQIQGNRACRNFVTKSRVNLRLITPCKNAHRDESEIYNFQRFNLISNNKYITGSWEVRLTWLDCSQRSYIQFFLGGHCVKMFGQPVHRRQSYFSTYWCLFNCQRKNKKIIYANVYRNTINDGDSQKFPLPIFPERVGTSVHRLLYSSV